ncbi:MAG: polysaccharide biosynthesis/export family protein [Pirellulales bacterium]|nr:polysaccharide biosynthesis/export family protein [Pirellulales bacterium]
MNLPIVGESLWRLAGWTMIHSLWIGALVAAVGATLRLALRRAAPGVRYAASLATLAGLSMAPIAIAAWLATHDGPASRGLPAPGAHPMASPAGAVFADAANWVPSFAPAPAPSAPPRVIDLKETPFVAGKPTPAGDWETTTSEAATWNEASGAQPAKPPAGGGPVPSAPQLVADGDGGASGAFWHTLLDGAVAHLPWAWLVGAPVTFAWLALGLTGAQRLRRNAVPVSDGPIVAAAERIRAALRISRQVAVAASDAIAQPVLVGIVRPLVLLPAAAVTGWGPEDLELALVHELAHVRRWDNAVNLAQRVVESCLWFHPAVWLASRQVRRDREECCDAIVVGLTGRPVEYADLLVTLAAKRRAPGARTPRLAAASAMANHPLASRVRRILNVERESMRVSRSTVCVVGAALAATAAGVVSLTAVSQKAIAVEGQAQTTVSQPAAQDRYTLATDLDPLSRTKEIRTTTPAGADERQLLGDIESQGFPCRIEEGVRQAPDGRETVVRMLIATVPADSNAKFVFESRQGGSGTRVTARLVGEGIPLPSNPMLTPQQMGERYGSTVEPVSPWPTQVDRPQPATSGYRPSAPGDEARIEAAIVDLEKRLLESRLEQARELAKLKSADRRLGAVKQALGDDAELGMLRSRISFVLQALGNDEIAALQTGDAQHVERMQKLKQQLAELQAELNAKRSVAVEKAERTFSERMEVRRDELADEYVGVQEILAEELAAKKDELQKLRSSQAAPMAKTYGATSELKPVRAGESVTLQDPQVLSTFNPYASAPAYLPQDWQQELMERWTTVVHLTVPAAPAAPDATADDAAKARNESLRQWQQLLTSQAVLHSAWEELSRYQDYGSLGIRIDPTIGHPFEGRLAVYIPTEGNTITLSFRQIFPDPDKDRRALDAIIRKFLAAAKKQRKEWQESDEEFRKDFRVLAPAATTDHEAARTTWASPPGWAPSGSSPFISDAATSEPSSNWGSGHPLVGAPATKIASMATTAAPVPTAPYVSGDLPPETMRLRPGETVVVQVLGAFPDKPIDGEYRLDEQGRLALGPAYGRVAVGGMTVEEAEAAVKKELSKMLSEVAVQITRKAAPEYGRQERYADPLDAAAGPGRGRGRPGLQGEVLLYDGQTFEQWRSKWRYELKTEKRIDAIEAMAAFGRAGKGREAAEAILDVAGEYDFTTWGGDGAGKLKHRTIELLTAGGDPQLPVEDWFPALVERYRSDAKKWGKLTDVLVSHLRHVDTQSQATLLEWARDRKSPLRPSALTALAASQSDHGRALLDELLAGDEADEAILALGLLTTPAGYHGFGSDGMGSGMPLTDSNLDALITGLTHPNERVQRRARQLMGATTRKSNNLSVAERVIQEAAGDSEPRKQVALVRALGLSGSRGADFDSKLAESLVRIGEESDSVEVQVAAIAAVCWLDAFERGVDRTQVGVEMLTGWNAELKADEARELILEEHKAAYTPDSTAPQGGGGFF